jgi:beta-1,4-mannosyltransferase
VAALPAPPEDGSAPYLRLLYEALGRRGVRVARVERADPRTARRHRLNVVHLHWLEYLTMADGWRGLRAARAHWRALRLLTGLAALRRTRTRVVWTVHNLRPHEARFRWLEAGVARATARLADALIVHSRYAAGRAAQRVGAASKLHVIPHGHFNELYPSSGRSRAQVRESLSLPPDAFTYLVFGQLRSYKRVPETIQAFRALSAPGARLVVAGAVRDPRLRRAIEREAAADDRVVLRLGFVPDDEVADLHLAADAAVVAYGEVFSSGALLLALGLGLPVVAPAESAAPELGGQPAVETFEPGGLTHALAAIARGEPESRRRAAREAALRCDWERIAAETLAVYRDERRPDGTSARNPAPSRSA